MSKKIKNLDEDAEYRKCLSCDKFFMSSCKSHRFCPKCKKNQNRHSGGLYTILDPAVQELAEEILTAGT
jgi:Zn finger protein HypA/HybF involved in hydrogenase expression